MAKFRCLLSGNIVEFTQQVDIDSMAGHEGYERVTEEGVKQVEQEIESKPLPLTAPAPSKPRGRPAKNKQG
jgi:hypothetical protein